MTQVRRRVRSRTNHQSAFRSVQKSWQYTVQNPLLTVTAADNALQSLAVTSHQNIPSK